MQCCVSERVIAGIECIRIGFDWDSTYPWYSLTRLEPVEAQHVRDRLRPASVRLHLLSELLTSSFFPQQSWEIAGFTVTFLILGVWYRIDVCFAFHWVISSVKSLKVVRSSRHWPVKIEGETVMAFFFLNHPLRPELCE